MSAYLGSQFCRVEAVPSASHPLLVLDSFRIISNQALSANTGGLFTRSSFLGEKKRRGR